MGLSRSKPPKTNKNTKTKTTSLPSEPKLPSTSLQVSPTYLHKGSKVAASTDKKTHKHNVKYAFWASNPKLACKIAARWD